MPPENRVAAGNVTMLPTLSDSALGRRWRCSIVVGGDPGAPDGGKTGMGKIGDQRKPVGDPQGAVELVRPHALGLVLVAEPVLLGVGDHNDGREDKRTASLFDG